VLSKPTDPWWVHGAVLGIFALLAVGVTIFDLSSGEMLKGVGTIVVWAAYAALAVGSSIVLLLCHRLVFKRRRPWLALGLAYLFPLVVYQLWGGWEGVRSLKVQADRRQHRQALADSCLDIVAWQVTPADGGGCDLVLTLRSKKGAVVELRPSYRDWFGRQSVHRLPAGSGQTLRRMLALGRPSTAHEWIARPQTACSAFDFRQFQFRFRCGGDPPAVIVFRSSALPPAVGPVSGPAPVIRPLPPSINEIRPASPDR
jgi:hypothetical protein